MQPYARFAAVFVCAFVGFSTRAATIQFSDPSGLAAEAEFTLLDSLTLQIRLRNTSTGVPGGFDSADQILTGISFDLGAPGANASDPIILGGVIVIGPMSQSLNFSTGNYGPGTDVGGEWGYGNTGGSGALTNTVSGNQAQVTPFGGPNLDGPDNLDGPQGGLVTNPPLVALGGFGAIADEVIATLTLSAAVNDLSFLDENLVRVEFGSDAAFITVPDPATLVGLGLGGVFLLGRRKSA